MRRRTRKSASARDATLLAAALSLLPAELRAEASAVCPPLLSLENVGDAIEHAYCVIWREVDLPKAVGEFRAIEADPKATPAQRGEARDAISRLAPNLATLRRAPGSSVASVSLKGTPPTSHDGARSDWRTPVVVSPGKYKVSVELVDGTSTPDRDVFLAPGTEYTVDDWSRGEAPNPAAAATARPPSDAAPSPAAPGPSSTPVDGDGAERVVPTTPTGDLQRGLGAGLGAAGIGVLTLATYFLVTAHSKESDANAQCGVGGNPNVCTSEGYATNRAAQTYQTSSQWAFGVGAVSLAAGFVLYLSAPKHRQDRGCVQGRVGVAPMLGSGTSGASLRLTW